nr:rho guanine nucleotide exchange factor 7 isoform X2 [Onthophagus taurus]
MSGEPLVVQAIYSFKGTNNDELCFKKGDKITITQKEDGGWWEGTLGGKTGWFPSNYVKECRDVSGPPPLTTITQQKQYREVVLKDVVDSEKAHVTELQGLVNNFLNPLEKSGILSPDEFQQLISNLYEIVDTHQQLLNTLEEELKLNHEARVGHIFLTRAPKIKSVHQTYCSLHPRAVCILDKYKDELTKFMESCNAAAPGILVLTTGLSKPFRRLDKYSGMLQELERHVEESHPDRGDTQRSVVVYKEIAATCEATRRQKELELQIVTGPVRGWEGQSLSTLGDIIYMGSVAIGPQHHDRYLVLFPSTLLMLSVSKRLSAFIYEGKLPLTGIVVTRLEDNDQFKNAFEINGPMIEKRIAVCQSRDEANHWVELLRKHMPNRSNSIHQKPLSTHVEVVQQPHPSPLVSTRGTNNRHGGPPNNNESRLISTPPSHGSFINNNNNNKDWSASCLRPAPPLSPCLAFGSAPYDPHHRANRKTTNYKEDALILDVIEAYCCTGKQRNTVNSVKYNQMQRSSEVERNLFEVVQILQGQVKNLENNLSTLTSQLTEEKIARCTLQLIVKNFLSNHNTKDSDKIEWPAGIENNLLT